MSEAILSFLNVDEEDDLTKAVFGGLELLGAPILERILKGISIGANPQFRYHERLESSSERIPDTIIETDESVIVIEAKRGTSFSQTQLEEEYQDLVDYTTKTPYLVLVTAHTARPVGLDDANIPTDDLYWIGWRNIALTLASLEEPELANQTQRAVAEVVIEVLREEGYVPFQGFESVLDADWSLVDELESTWEILSGFYNQLNTFRRDIDGQVADQGLRIKDIYRDGRSESLSAFPTDYRFIMDHLWFVYGEPEFEVSGKGGDYHLICFNTTTGELRVGYSIRPRNEQHQDVLSEHVDEICDFVESNNAKVFRASWNNSLHEELTDEQSIRDSLTDDEWLDDANRVQVGYQHGSDELSNPDLSSKVADELIEVHDFASQHLYLDQLKQEE